MGQSKETRSITEDLLEANKDKFLQALEVQNKSLEELQQKADEVDRKVRELSGKVGGASGHLGVTSKKKKLQKGTKAHFAPCRCVEVMAATPSMAAASTARAAAPVARTSRGTWSAAGRGATGRAAPLRPP